MIAFAVGKSHSAAPSDVYYLKLLMKVGEVAEIDASSLDRDRRSFIFILCIHGIITCQYLKYCLQYTICRVFMSN